MRERSPPGALVGGERQLVGRPVSRPASILLRHDCPPCPSHLPARFRLPLAVRSGKAGRALRDMGRRPHPSRRRFGGRARCPVSPRERAHLPARPAAAVAGIEATASRPCWWVANVTGLDGPRHGPPPSPPHRCARSPHPQLALLTHRLGATRRNVRSLPRLRRPRRTRPRPTAVPRSPRHSVSPATADDRQSALP